MGGHRQRLLDGREYLAEDPELVADRLHTRRLLARFNELGAARWPEGRMLLDELLGSVGADVQVLAPLFCDYGHPITIGDRSFLNAGSVILDSAPVTIGADVQIGPGVQLLSPVHPLDPGRRREGWERGSPVTIGDNAWLAAGVIVCPGVTIGPDALVGAGSVVTRDLPARQLCVGNPCRPIRAL